MMRKSNTSSSNTGNAVVLLERVPVWISELRTVKVFNESQELVITSLPSSSKHYEYRTVNNLCKNGFLNESNQDVESERRLTRSTGGKLDVDFNAKLPDDRNYRCKVFDPCSDPFLGFESCHHAISLSNNEVFQFLSKVEDKMATVMTMVMTDIDWAIEELEKSEAPENKTKSIQSMFKSKAVKTKGKSPKAGRSKACFPPKKSSGQGIVQSNDGNYHTLVDGQVIAEKSSCGNDFCRLGCMCESLKAKTKRTHCGHAECMFSKKCCIGPTSTPTDSNKLTLLSQTANTSDTEVIPAKRTRRPPKRWLEEEEELEYMAEMKKKLKLSVHASSTSMNKRKEGESSSVLESEFNALGAKRQCSEHNSLNHNESTSLLKRPCNIALKSTSGKFTFTFSHLNKNVIEENLISNRSLPGSILENGNIVVSSSPSSVHMQTSVKELSKFDENSMLAVIKRQYFRHYKEYRKILMLAEVSEKELKMMCSTLLTPLHINSMKLMTWCDLEGKVREGCANLWLSQVPKCVAKIYVSESEIPPDPNSANFKYVENVCNIPSSIDYLFQLYNQPELYGCCVLSCQGFYWEIKSNLNMKTKVCDRILFKIMRSSTKSSKELTFANGGKKILICGTTSAKYNEDTLRGSYVPEDTLEAEINEIPEPDIHMYHSSCAQSTEQSESSSIDQIQVSPETGRPEISCREEFLPHVMQPKPPVMVAPTARSLLEQHWYCLNLDKSFDKIIIDKPNFSATYTQMVYALRISRERDIAVRISCIGGASYMFNNNVWRQGIYADYTLSDIAVKIGPYYNYEVPEIRAFVKVNGILCPTYVRLIKEPFNEETMPRVTKRENKTADKSFLSFCNTKAKSGKTGENKMGIGSQKSESSSVNHAPINPISETDNSSSIVSKTYKHEHNESDLRHEFSEPSDTSQPGFNIRIESVLGNWSGFDDIVNPVSEASPVTKDSVLVKNSVNTANKCTFPLEYGYLVSEIPGLKAIFVTRGGKSHQDSNNITVIDATWREIGKPMIFKNVDSASHYLQSVTKVKMYPDNLRIKWVFMKDYKYLKMKKCKKCFDIRELTEDQFITHKGLFSYDDVCYDNLAQYGLKTIDNRRLLEFRRRREIRDAKNELISLLPDPKTDVLVRVIHRSRLLIRALEEKGKSLQDKIKGERARKFLLLNELRQKCSDEKMYKIHEQIQKMSRPHVDNGLDYKSAFQGVIPRKRRRTISRKPSGKKGKSRASSVKTTKKLPKKCLPSVPAVSAEPPKQCMPSVVADTAKSPMRCVPLVVAKPAVKDNRVSQELGEATASTVKVIKVIPRGMTTVPAPTKEPFKARNVFSGRYVSAATKRSLRKYNYIIPCLARKNNSILKKMKSGSQNGNILVNAENYRSVPFCSSFQKSVFRSQEDTDQDLPEETPVIPEKLEELNQCQDVETSDDPAPEYMIQIPKIEESDPFQEYETKDLITDEHILMESDPHGENGSYLNGINQENTEKAETHKEYSVLELEKYGNPSSVESLIDVGSKDDMLPMTAPMNAKL